MFYTNVLVRSGKIYYRGLENGRRVEKKIQYSPTIFVTSSNGIPTEYKTLDGQPLYEMKFDSIPKCNEFIYSYKDVTNFKLYGNKRYEHAYISEKFPQEVPFDHTLIQVDNIDIECKSDDGFPVAKLANQEITSITVLRNGKFYVFGCKPYKQHRDDVVFELCANERQLLIAFLMFWSRNYPDIITGWNVQEFDIVYLYNRIKNVLNETEAKRLSPWKMVNERKKVVLFAGQAKTIEYVDLLGISIVDYMTWFKKQPQNNVEQYSLDHVAHVVLGENKLSYEEYGNLRRLYEENPQKFYEYNIKDVELVDKLDKKQNLIRLAIMLAYDSKCNFEEVLYQVRMWTQISRDFLLNKRKIVLPLHNDFSDEDSSYDGAFVKEPIVGLKKDVISIDAEALYPSIIQCFNISPETFVRVDPVNVNDLVAGKTDIEDDLTLCGNGARFRRDKQGFFVDLVDHYKIRRKEAKAKMIEYEKLKEKTKDKKYEALIETYDTRQAAMKVALNSLYGALGSKYFLFYNEVLAEAITLTGQYIILSIEKKVNDYLNKIAKLDTPYQFCVYCDTDSVYIELFPLIDKMFPDKKGIERIDLMDNLYKNVFDEKFKSISVETTKYVKAHRNDIIFKREIIGDVGIWIKKKRYIINVYDKEGVRYDKPKIMIKGLETRKSDTPQVCRNYLTKAIEIMINGTEKDILAFIKEKKKEYFNLPIEDIAKPISAQNVVMYSTAEKSIPIQVKGAIVYNKTLEKYKLQNEYEKIKDGEKVKYVYLKQPNPFHSHVIAFPIMAPKELELNQYVDYNIMFEKTFLEPLKKMLNPIGWKTEKRLSLKSLKKNVD